MSVVTKVAYTDTTLILILYNDVYQTPAPGSLWRYHSATSLTIWPKYFAIILFSPHLC